MNGVYIFILDLYYLVVDLTGPFVLFRHVVTLPVFPFRREIICESPCQELSV
jgi:hypothetical protein